ncbi:hypothetical protein BOX15_Mlig033075g3, partial [Macrostomum lignano]
AEMVATRTYMIRSMFWYGQQFIVAWVLFAACIWGATDGSGVPAVYWSSPVIAVTSALGIAAAWRVLKQRSSIPAYWVCSLLLNLPAIGVCLPGVVGGGDLSKVPAALSFGCGLFLLLSAFVMSLIFAIFLLLHFACGSEFLRLFSGQPAGEAEERRGLLAGDDGKPLT